MSSLKLKIEALLFAADAPLNMTTLCRLIGESIEKINLSIKELHEDYLFRSFQLYEWGGHFQIRTREEYKSLVQKLFISKPRHLSKASLETLAIIAYRQPITRIEINLLRQADSSALLSSLKEKNLVRISGHRKELGNPIEYSTTDEFLSVFNLTSLQELPKLKNIQMNLGEYLQARQKIQTLSKETAKAD
jgi:segregation and condensation protein B